MIKGLVVAALLAATPVAFQAVAAPESGQVVAVVQSASVTGSVGKRTLETGAPVSVGERIETNGTGQVQLLFTDGTKLVVGPRSSLLIEAYLLRSKSTVSRFAVTALGGSFRFITGKSPKNAYSIKTPTATIGVRGTSFDLAVRSSASELVLFSGVAQLCGSGGCVVLRDGCSLARAPRSTGSATSMDEVRLERSRARRNQAIRARFPYIVSQAPLRPDFRVQTGSCGDIQAALPNQSAPAVKGVSPSAPQAPGPGPAPDPGPTPDPGGVGNPGTGGTQGNAGPSPGGNDMGSPGKGRSDNNGNGNGNGNGKGNGRGQG